MCRRPEEDERKLVDVDLLLFVCFFLTLDFVTVKYSSVVYVANEALRNYLFIFVRRSLFLF